MQKKKKKEWKRIYKGCSVRIENSVTRDNGSASLGKPRDAEQLPSWWNFQYTPHNHSYTLIPVDFLQWTVLMLFNVCMIVWWQVAESFLVFHGFVTKFYVSFVLSSIVINTMRRVSWSLCWLSCLRVHVLWFHVLHLFSLSRIRAVIFDCDTPRWSFFSDFISKRLSFGSKEVTQINWARSWVAVDNATLLIVSSVM